MTGLKPVAYAQPPGSHPEVYRFETPPAGFRALTASDEDLARFGLPARPNPFTRSALTYATWSRIMTAARIPVSPEIRIRGRHGPAIALKRTRAITAGTMAAQNWAGQVLQSGATSYGSGSYTKVLAQWVVSAVQQAIGACTNGTDYSATWIGLDGANTSADVMQAGTESDASCHNGITTANYYPWFEWYPANGYEVTNFKVYPGAPVFVVLQANSPTTASVTFVNIQSNQFTTVGFSAPAGTSLKGSSAEWIVERPALDSKGTLSTLANYGYIWMSSEVAYVASELGTSDYDIPGQTHGGRTGYTLTMVDSSNAPIATAYPQGASAQYIGISGSAY